MDEYDLELQQRILPCLIDGLSNTQRKILYMLQNHAPNEMEQKLGYHHGSIALAKVYADFKMKFDSSFDLNLFFGKGVLIEYEEYSTVHVYFPILPVILLGVNVYCSDTCKCEIEPINIRNIITIIKTKLTTGKFPSIYMRDHKWLCLLDQNGHMKNYAFSHILECYYNARIKELEKRIHDKNTDIGKKQQMFINIIKFLALPDKNLKIEQTLVLDFDKIDDSHNYLLNLPVSSNIKTYELKLHQETSPIEIWLNELDKFSYE